MVSVFSRFAPRLQEAIVARLGWQSLRPVQELAGQALLDGHNAVILAPTAGGKTEAAMFPAISRLVEHEPAGVGVIYVAPLKALLNNQSERLDVLTGMVGLRRFVWHGDVSAHAKKTFLKEPTEVLMTTPESLEVMLMSARVDAGRLFSDVRMVVIDEVHALAGTDRGAHLMSVIERVARLSRHDVQRAGLSATVGNPAMILRWLGGTSRRDGVVVDPPRGTTARRIEVNMLTGADAVAAKAAKIAQGKKTLFFCETRAMTEVVAEAMQGRGTEVFVHHSAVSQEERANAEARFAKGESACVVCTSTLELGIDVGDLDTVIQADAPRTVSAFMQRLGRTGRREGTIADMRFLCESTDSVMLAVTLISLAKRGWVESVVVDERCWPVLIHQVLAMALAGDGVLVDELWAIVAGVPDFRMIGREEFDGLIGWLLGLEALVWAGPRLVVGPKVEALYGKKNFQALYSVFTTPQNYTVVEANREIGTLDQEFVDRLVDDVSCFLLAGRAWVVKSVSHQERRVWVEKAPRGKEPTWGGVLPLFLGFEVCQEMLAILQQDDVPRGLDAVAQEALVGMRATIREEVAGPDGGLVQDESGVRWWTFAGGQINMTLKHAMIAAGADWRIVVDNMMVRISGDGLTDGALRAVLERVAVESFWRDEVLWGEVAEGLPSYRLSKFQPLMPVQVEQECLARYLLNTNGAWMWLSERGLAGLAQSGWGVRA